jgi:hypothetical protein
VNHTTLGKVLKGQARAATIKSHVFARSRCWSPTKGKFISGEDQIHVQGLSEGTLSSVATDAQQIYQSSSKSKCVPVMCRGGNIQKMTIARCFRGPPNSGNGGYVCGMLARHITGRRSHAARTAASGHGVERRRGRGRAMGAAPGHGSKTSSGRGFPRRQLGHQSGRGQVAPHRRHALVNQTISEYGAAQTAQRHDRLTRAGHRPKCERFWTLPRGSKYCRKTDPDAGGENRENVKSQPIDLLMTDVTRTLNARAKRHRLSVDRHAIHRMRRSHVAPRRLLSTQKQAHTRPEAAVLELYASLARWAQ